MANMIGNGSCVQSELTSGCWSAPSSARLGFKQTLVCGFRCSLILFSVVWIYLNHFNCSPSQKSGKGIWYGQTLEIEVVVLSLYGCTLWKLNWPESKRKELCSNLLYSLFITFRQWDSLRVGCNNVKHPQIDLERLHFARSTSQL